MVSMVLPQTFTAVDFSSIILPVLPARFESADQNLRRSAESSESMERLVFAGAMVLKSAHLFT
jgi:hypothetical protein